MDLMKVPFLFLALLLIIFLDGTLANFAIGFDGLWWGMALTMLALTSDTYLIVRYIKS